MSVTCWLWWHSLLKRLNLKTWCWRLSWLGIGLVWLTRLLTLCVPYRDICNTKQCPRKWSVKLFHLIETRWETTQLFTKKSKYANICFQLRKTFQTPRDFAWKVKAKISYNITVSTHLVMHCTCSVAWEVWYSCQIKGTSSSLVWAAHSNLTIYESSSLLNSRQVVH